MSVLAQLWIGDSSSSGAIDLNDGTNYTIPMNARAVGGVTVPPGITFGAVERGVVRGPLVAGGSGGGGTPVPASGWRPITIGVEILGASNDAVEDGFNAVLRYLERARLASGPFAQGTELYFAYRPDGATNTVFWNVVGGNFPPIVSPYPWGASQKRKYGVLTLYCQPYAHLPVVNDSASATLTNGSAATAIYRSGVKGTVEALFTTTITDKSTGLPTVTGLALSQVAGTLGAGTYNYRVAAATVYGVGIPCAQVAITITATHGVQLTWNAVPSAGFYYVYGRTAGAELFLGSVYGSVTTWTDDGSGTPSGALPVVDNSSLQLVRLTLGRVARLPSMTSTDLTPIVKLTAKSPGAATTETVPSYTGANFSRLVTPAASWQTVAEATQPAGVFQHGLFLPKVRVRDAGTVLAAPSNTSTFVANTGGSLPVGSYSAFLTAYDNNLNETLPVALPTVTVYDPTKLFYDGAESGDIELWDAILQSQIGSGVADGAGAVVHAETDAACPDVPNSLYGFRATAAGGLSAWVYRDVSGHNTVSIRCRIRINTDTGANSVAGVWNGIPLLLKSDGTWLIGLVQSGSGWKFATISGATATQTGAQVQLSGGGVWQILECTFAWNGSTSYTCSAYLNDTLSVTATISSTTAPGKLGIGAAVGGTAPALDVFYDNVQIDAAHIGSPQAHLLYQWTPATPVAAATVLGGYYLYIQHNNGAWLRYAIGSGIGTATYAYATISGGTLVSGPPTGIPAVQPALIRIGAAVNTTNALADSAYTWSKPVAVQVGMGLWEILRATPIPLAPMPRQQGVANGSEDAWRIRVQVMSESTSPASVDVDYVALYSVTGSDAGCTIEAPADALSAAGAYRFNHRFDGERSCDILDAATGTTVIGQARVRGDLSFAPGDNLLVVDAEVQHPIVQGGPPISDVVSCKFTAQSSHWPQFDHAAGVAL